MLARLNEVGLSGVVPAPLDLTAEIEQVSFLPGDSGSACWTHQATEVGLRSAARLLRRVHDASAGWVPSAGAVWGVPPVQPFEVICHGDPGPWNMAWIDGIATGLFDWDFCHPGSRLEDVAYALEYLAPFRDDDEATRWHGFICPPDRPRRIEVFCDEYGIASTGLVDAVLDVQERAVVRVQALAKAGVQPQSDWVGEGYLDVLRRRVEWTATHRHLFS